MMIKNKNEYECIYFHARPPYCTVARARMIKMRKESAWGVYNNKSVSSWMEGVQRDTIAIIARLSAKRLARAAQNEQRESEDEKKKKKPAERYVYTRIERERNCDGVSEQIYDRKAAWGGGRASMPASARSWTTLAMGFRCRRRASSSLSRVNVEKHAYNSPRVHSVFCHRATPWLRLISALSADSL